MVTNSWFASKLDVCWTLWSLLEKEWKVRVRRRKGRQRKRNGGNNIICCLPVPYTLQTFHFVADAAPVLTLWWEGNVDFPQSPFSFSERSSRSSALRYVRSTILVSNVPSLAWRWTWNWLRDPCSLGTYETKMTARTGKCTFLTIFRKNRGLWTVYKKCRAQLLFKKTTWLRRES